MYSRSARLIRFPRRRQVQVIVFQQVDRIFSFLPFLQRVISLQRIISLQRVIAHKQLK
jgi:hypothetical protein